MTIFMLRMIDILIKIMDHLYLCLSSIKYTDTIEKKFVLLLAQHCFSYYLHIHSIIYATIYVCLTIHFY